MNLLYSNDSLGAYPDSWYHATADLLPRQAELSADTRADVCVIGAGFTGLSAALHLAQAGRDVVLIDAQRIGFGASGRNGGQLGSGQRVEQPDLEQMFGQSQARAFWQLGQESKTLVKGLIKTHDIACYLRPGVAWTASSKSDLAHLHAYADHMAKHYNYELETLDHAGLQEVCPSPDYVGGIIDWDAGHLHPLRFALGLGAAALRAGVRVYEGTRALSIEQGKTCVIRCPHGTISADQLVIAANGYLGDLEPKVAARVMPINNFIAATEPLGDAVAKVLKKDIAVADSRFVVNYFRLSHDGRLLFGGGESYGYKFPADLKAKVRKPMLEIFPHLKDTRIDYAWGGTLAITIKRLPYLRALAPNVLTASGYSGHGVGTATHAGQLMALALQGQSEGFDTMASIPAMPFPGGRHLRNPLLVLAMSWYSLRDRLGL